MRLMSIAELVAGDMMDRCPTGNENKAFFDTMEKKVLPALGLPDKDAHRLRTRMYFRFRDWMKYNPGVKRENTWYDDPEWDAMLPIIKDVLQSTDVSAIPFNSIKRTVVNGTPHLASAMTNREIVPLAITCMKKGDVMPRILALEGWKYAIDPKTMLASIDDEDVNDLTRWCVIGRFLDTPSVQLHKRAY